MRFAVIRRTKFVSFSAVITFLTSSATPTTAPADIGIAAALPRRQEHRERSGGDLRGRLRVYTAPSQAEKKVGQRLALCTWDRNRTRSRLLRQQSIEFSLPISTTEVACALEKSKPRPRTRVYMRMYQKFDADYSHAQTRTITASACQRNILTSRHDTTSGWNRLLPVSASKQPLAASGRNRTGRLRPVRLLAKATFAMGRPLVPGRHRHTL